jgi:CHASE2 domain-containing sensor protein
LRDSSSISECSPGEPSRKALDQSYYKDCDRTWHAHLLNHLTQDRAKLVVLDIYLTEPGRPAANAALSNAIAAHGNVVLAADLSIETKEGLGDLLEGAPPREEFVAAARSWGIARQPYSAGSVVRQLYPNSELHPSLAWATRGRI